MGSASAAANTASLITVVPVSSTKLDIHDKFSYGFHLRRGGSIAKFTAAISPNGSVSPSSSHGAGCSAGDADKQRSSLESLFCYDKSTGRENREAYWDIFVPLVLVQACMLIQYWRARVLLSKFAAPLNKWEKVVPFGYIKAFNYAFGWGERHQMRAIPGRAFGFPI